MDGNRFDFWTASLTRSGRTRRGAMQLGLAAVAAVAGGGATAGEALACRKNGRDCDPDKKNQCCSGNCKRKRDGKGVCKRAPSAFGCTIKDDTCNKSPNAPGVPCPGRPERSCVVLDNGQPFCAAAGICTDCTSDRDCKRGGRAGKCITKCRTCIGQESRLRACVFAKAPTPDV